MRGSRHIACLLSLSVIALSAIAGIAGSQTLRPGTEVRIWSSHSRLSGHHGTLLEIDGPNILLSMKSDQPLFSLGRADITRLQVNVPRTASEGAKDGFLKGAAGGSVFGLVVSAAIVAVNRSVCWGTACNLAVFENVVPLGAAMGAIGGLLVGAAAPGSSWQCVRDWPCENPQQLAGILWSDVSAHRLGLRIRF